MILKEVHYGNMVRVVEADCNIARFIPDHLLVIHKTAGAYIVFGFVTAFARGRTWLQLAHVHPGVFAATEGLERAYFFSEYFFKESLLDCVLFFCF